MNEFEIDWERWAAPKPMGISGCFRLRDEAQFMEAAVLSHLEWLDEAVLVVQPSEDETVELAYRLAAEDERVRVVYYPYEVDWIDTPGFYAKDPDQPGHLVHLSNWAFNQCRYAWIAKIEGDVIGLSTFGKIIKQVKRHPDVACYYGRVLLNLAGEKCDMISMKHPRNAGWDECVCPNDPKWRFERNGKFESLYIGEDRQCMGWSGLHMKRCKTEHIERISQVEEWKPFTEANLADALQTFNRGMDYPADDNPLGESCLYERRWIDYYLEGQTCPR